MIRDPMAWPVKHFSLHCHKITAREAPAVRTLRRTT